MILDYSTHTQRICEAYEQKLMTEAAKLQEKFKDKRDRDIFLNVVKKASTNEWVVKVHINGKYDEDATYYTDDKEDAISTMAAMKERYINFAEKADAPSHFWSEKSKLAKYK